MWEKVGYEELIKDLRRVRQKLGHWPRVREYRKYGRHSVTSFFRYFGSWRKALSFAQQDAETIEQWVERIKSM